MEPIIPVLVGAIVTGVFGNFLAQRWQLRGWREQQRQLGYQAELDDLKRLLEEITTKSADRYNAMRRLIGSLSPNSNVPFAAALTNYQEQLDVWNGVLNSLFVRIRLAAGYNFSIRFERDVHDSFYDAGVSIEHVIRSQKGGKAVNWSDLTEPKKLLNHNKVEIYNFLRDLMEIIEERRGDIFHGKKYFYRDGLISEYSILHLIKCLFISEIDRFYIVRPA